MTSVLPAAVESPGQSSVPGFPEKWNWFPLARYGLFIHWGPYSAIGRGEQVLFRERLDPREYELSACEWNPQSFDANEWAQAAVRGGFRYAVLTTRHHDGYCLWDSALTDYTSAQQAPKRDFVREYVDAFRAAGLKVGLYYSLADWRIPAYWSGPAHDPQGWDIFREYVHGQVAELLTNYGQIDELWFDGSWPRNANAWQSHRLLRTIRSLQPNILVNNRLDAIDPDEGLTEWQKGAVENAGESKDLGDFGTPEHHITAEPRPWESCQTMTSRLWGHTIGENWRTSEQLLDFLCETASKGGNLLLNVGPEGDGPLPQEFTERSDVIGDWLKINGEAIYGAQAADLIESVTRGWQTRRENVLYLILRFWDQRPEIRLTGIETELQNVELLGFAGELSFTQESDETNGGPIVISGLPSEKPGPLFPVLKLTFAHEPTPIPQFTERLWTGNPRRMLPWANQRGDGLNAYKG